MYDTMRSQSQGRSLIQLGVVLLLFGMPTALLLLGRMHTTMEMVDHVDAWINGIFLIVLGLIWSHLKLPHPWRVIVYRLTLYGTLIKWIGLLTLVWWIVQGGLAVVPTGTFVAFLLHDILLSLGWFFLVVAVIAGTLLAAYAAHKYRLKGVDALGERQPPVT